MSNKRFASFVLLACIAFALFLTFRYTKSYSGQDILLEQEHITQCYIHKPWQDAYPVTGGFSIVLENKELETFLECFNQSTYHYAFPVRKGGPSILPGAAWEICLEYDQAPGVTMTITSERYIQTGNKLYRATSGEVLKYLESLPITSNNILKPD